MRMGVPAMRTTMGAVTCLICLLQRLPAAEEIFAPGASLKVESGGGVGGEGPAWRAACFAGEQRKPVRLRGAVVDANTGRPLACRIYLQSEGGEWFFPKSESPQGSALAYRKKRDEL